MLSCKPRHRSTPQEGSTILGQYVYNALNQRVKKTVQGQTTTVFHYDLQGKLIAETDATGTTLVEYFYLGDQLLAMIRPTEALYYYHNDHLGTPQILTNYSGTVSWKATYTPFGEAVTSVETVENPFRFPGQYYDQETGIHYNWNRYYDPKTGRYLTPDPIGLEGGINLFPYVANSPLNAADPSGLEVRIDPKNGIPYIPQPKPYYPCGPLGCGYGECGITGDGRIVYGRTDLDPGRRVCIDCNPVALFGCLAKLPSPDAAVATGKCLLSIFFFVIGRGEIDCAACSNFGIALASRITTCLAENCRIGKRDECGRCNYN
jgi:RHS repeat-associated protein